MALSIAIAGTQTIDLTTKNKATKQYGLIYEEIFVNTNTIEKVIVVDPRRSNALQVKGNGTDTFIISTTIAAGVGNTDILDAAVPWIEVEASSSDDYQSGGGGINKDVLAIKVVSIALVSGDIQISCTQSSDDE